MVTPNKLKSYAILARMHKPIPILLLLWPTLWALWIATSGQPDFSMLMIFIIGTCLMRSAGCVVNDITDRDLDKHVARTKDRPLASGDITLTEAIIVFALLSALALVCLLLLGPLAIVLGVCCFLLALLYPWCKRFTYLPQLLLGVLFSWGVPMAFAATQQAVPLQAWVLFAIAALWPVAYDTVYAMIDREDDMKIGIKSTAILFGKADVFIVMSLQFTVLLALAWYGHWLRLNRYFYLGLIAAALLSVYQFILIRQPDHKRYLRAFLNNHWVGMAIFVGIFLAYAA